MPSYSWPSYSWFDSHCHFDFAAFSSQRETHWQLAQQLGVTAIIIPGVSRQQSANIRALCQNKPWFYSLGLHPYFLNQHNKEDLDWLAQELSTDPHIIALGEMGLDLPSATTTELQQQQFDLFAAQVALAKQFNKPLIVHIRGQHDQAASYLRHQHFTQGGVVHAFSGSEQQAKAWLDLGFKLGIGGAMTHPRAHKLRRTIQAAPLNAWLLETDGPDMKAAFWGDNIYGPAAIPLLAACLATLKKCSLEELSMAQKQNFLDIWPNSSIK